jgi:hypothetical protein
VAANFKAVCPNRWTRLRNPVRDLFGHRRKGQKTKLGKYKPVINPIIAQRMTARMETEFCVFLIGMRINRPLKLHKWFPVVSAMPRMLRELASQKELGFLNGHFWFGRTIITLQYWRSTKHLMDFATNKNFQHLPAWTAFTRSIGNSGDVGIWHETYVIRPGSCETIYHNMPAFGLGRVGSLVPATGHYQHAQERLQPTKQ